MRADEKPEGDLQPPIKTRVADAALVRRRRQQIASAAVELFSDRGYYRTTVQDVADKAGVSAGLIYQYFQDKDDILLVAILEVIESYRTEIPASMVGLSDPLVRFREAVATYCRVVDARREATVLAYRSTKSLPAERRRLIMEAETETNNLIAECIQACVDSGLFRQLDVEFVTYQLVMFAHSWALKHWRLSRKYTIEQYIEQGLSLYMAACLSQAGWRHLPSVLPDRQ